MKHILALLAVIIMTLFTYAQTVEVCKTCPISTLSDGIAQAKDFDTIVLFQIMLL